MVQKGFDGYAIPSLSLSPAFPGSQKLRANGSDQTTWFIYRNCGSSGAATAHTVICAGLLNSPSTLADSESDLNEAANSNEQHTAGCLKWAVHHLQSNRKPVISLHWSCSGFLAFNRQPII